MILARLLLKADFGIAAVFGMVLSVFELAGKLSLGRLVVQDADGNKPSFLATAHSLQLGLSVLSALLLFAVAAPFAHIFDIREQLPALYCLALFPLFKGLEHLDISRRERDFDFVPSSLATAAPQLFTTLLTWPVASWIPDYRSVLILLAAKAILTTGLTHTLAHTRFTCAWDAQYVSRQLRFGWPLVVNGFLMLGVFQGDQFVVGSNYSLEDLATYSAAATLAMAPSFVVAKALASTMLPALAAARSDLPLFQRRYRLLAHAVAGSSVFYSVTTIVAAELWMILVYGPKYCDGALVLVWLAAANSLRIIRVAPAIAALARADSKNQMFATLLRVVTLAPALYCAAFSYPMWSVAATAVLGEFLACVYSIARLARRDHVPWSITLVPLTWTVLSCAVAFFASYMFVTVTSFWMILPAISLAFVFGTLTLCWDADIRVATLEYFATHLLARLRSKRP